MAYNKKRREGRYENEAYRSQRQPSGSRDKPVSHACTYNYATYARCMVDEVSPQVSGGDNMSPPLIIPPRWAWFLRLPRLR